MTPEFEARIREVVWAHDVQFVLDLIKHEYEFECPSFIYAGPGHQSRHNCEVSRPHPLHGEHSNSLYEWEGTATITTNAAGTLLVNARHTGGTCGCSY